MTFDELRRDYFGKLEEDGRRAATHRIESALAHARGIQGPGCPPAGLERRVVSDPTREFSEEVGRLTDWCGKNGFSTGYRPESLGQHDAEGTEHLVWYEQNRVRKISFSSHGYSNQGPYGQTIEAFHDTELDGSTVVVMENRKASPAEYLERIYLQNLLFNIDNRLEGFHPFGFETTQPLFEGEAVGADELASFLEAFGFERINRLTWYSRNLEVAISDVSLHNVIRSSGLVFPFDIWARRIRLHVQ